VQFGFLVGAAALGAPGELHANRRQARNRLAGFRLDAHPTFSTS